MCSFVDLFSCNKPDEEIGGADGMGQLLAAPETLKTLQPIGFALDEGLANPRRAFTLFYGERTPWWLLIRAKGPTVWARATRFHQKCNSSWTPEVYCVCVFFFSKIFRAHLSVALLQFGHSSIFVVCGSYFLTPVGPRQPFHSEYSS